MLNPYEKKQIAVMTSIAPKDIENQRLAVSSWLAAGFRVMSFNCMEEIAVIKPFFPDIEFIPAKRDARDKFGKSYVYASDIMRFFAEGPYETCGFINSDIHIRNVDGGMMRFVEEQARGSILFGQRIDVDSLDHLSGSLCVGYDYFFFDKRVAGIYGDAVFCVGQPVWDYWVIINAVLNNVEVKKLMNPIAYHVRHPLKWNVDINTEFRKIVNDNYISRKYPDLTNDTKSLDREYGRLAFNSCREVLYMEDKQTPSVLVAYNTLGNEAVESSETYRSIKDQDYCNFRIICYSGQQLDLEKVTEEYICFVNEGSILNKCFLSIMTAAAKGYDCSCCGLKITNSRNLALTYTYPLESLETTLEYERAADDYLLYATAALRKLGSLCHNYQAYRINRVAEGLVENISNLAAVLFSEGRYEELISKYKACKQQEVLYYLGISNIKTGHLDEGMECLLEFADLVNSQSRQGRKSTFYAYIFDEIIESGILDSEKGSLLWNRLRGILPGNADIRFRVLFLLYKNRCYEKIISLNGIESPETYFYIGRAYKELEDYTKSIAYLRDYINLLEAWSSERDTPVFGKDFLLSAYFHLGEDYYQSGVRDKSVYCFEKCRLISGGAHIKAMEYLKCIK